MSEQDEWHGVRLNHPNCDECRVVVDRWLVHRRDDSFYLTKSGRLVTTDDIERWVEQEAKWDAYVQEANLVKRILEIGDSFFHAPRPAEGQDEPAMPPDVRPPVQGDAVGPGERE